MEIIEKLVEILEERVEDNKNYSKRVTEDLQKYLIEGSFDKVDASIKQGKYHETVKETYESIIDLINYLKSEQ